MPLHWSVAYTVRIQKLVVSNFNQGRDNLVWLTFNPNLNILKSQEGVGRLGM